jgi:hypothetical protein
MRTFSAFLLLSLVLAVTAGTASAAEQVVLDLGDSATETTAVGASTVLETGQPYVISVTGTGSIWSADHWKRPGICGAPESKPMLASPGVENGLVGWDAETVFAVPAGVGFLRECSPNAIPLHVKARSGGGFKINLGPRFSHFEPAGGERATPRADHTYHYELKGEGQAPRFSFFDESTEGRRNDNYGKLAITIRTPAECAAVNCLATAGREFDKQAPAAALAGAPAAANSPNLTLPSNRKCASRRKFQIRIKEPRGVKFRRATVTLNDRVFKVVRQGRLKATIDLSGLPPGRFKIRIAATTTRGQILRSTRSYRTCTKKSQPTKSKSKSKSKS